MSKNIVSAQTPPTKQQECTGRNKLGTFLHITVRLFDEQKFLSGPQSASFSALSVSSRAAFPCFRDLWCECYPRFLRVFTLLCICFAHSRRQFAPLLCSLFPTIAFISLSPSLSLSLGSHSLSQAVSVSLFMEHTFLRLTRHILSDSPLLAVPLLTRSAKSDQKISRHQQHITQPLLERPGRFSAQPFVSRRGRSSQLRIKYDAPVHIFICMLRAGMFSTPPRSSASTFTF